MFELKLEHTNRAHDIELNVVITHDTAAAAAPKDVLEHMLGRAFLDELVRTIDVVSSIEETSLEASGDRIERVLRYTAPTAGKIPSFLKKYESKAPSHVYWEERGTWDLTTLRYTYAIVAEVPENWQRYYAARGSVAIEGVPGGSAVHATLNYDVNVFGLKRIIERALSPEVTRILELQGEATLRHFR